MAAIENDPFADGEIVLRLVIQGAWYRLVFDFDNKRFTEGKFPDRSLRYRAASRFLFSLW